MTVRFADNFAPTMVSHTAGGSGTINRPNIGRAVRLPDRKHRFVRRLGRALRDRCAIKPDSTLVIAASGGADSLALVAGMTALARRPHLRFRLVVVYVHHHLRPEADLESSSLDSLARQLGWEFRCVDVYPDLESGNVSSVARRLRYDALGLVACDVHADAVVTAHHGTDQLETLLWAIVRGAGLAGLQGMAWRSTFSQGTVVRPLLDQSHSDCVALCNDLRWSWFEDPGNRMRNRFRGRLRTEVLPCLEDFGRGLDRRIHQLTTLIREANNLVMKSTNGIFMEYGGSWYADRDQVRLMAPILLGSGLRQAAISLGAPPDRLSNRLVLHAVELIVDNARHPRRIEWPAGVVIEVAADHILVSHIGTNPTNPAVIAETATGCRKESYDAR